jgi:4-amino-4-deoxy-L-arabinose transferase-like glycosyltransferase
MPTNIRTFTFFALAVIGACVIVYLCGWHIPLMEIDAVQYANISREMLHSGHYLQLYDRGRDYLDKPPMLFWLSAASMRLFGVSGGAYRLPSFLFSLVAIYSTYRLALLFYRKEIALLSAVILASCQALFLINHDVRTDTMLMGWVALTLWQMAAWYRTRSWGHFLLAAVAVAGGMMTKGPIAIMVPVFCFGPHFLLQRSYRQFFRWEYIPLLLIVAVLLVPMCIGLYEQYDLHPGKVIDRLTIKSGLRFFFWTQSFGRVTGESQWHENDSFFFLFQNMLWSFLPWIIFFVMGLVQDIRRLIRNRGRLPLQEEWISTGGFLVTYCALGSSHAQLPHYIFVVFPLAAIISAKAFYSIFFSETPAAGQTRRLKGERTLFTVHVVIFGLLWVALLLLLFLPFASISRVLGGAAVLAAGGWIYLLVRKDTTYPRLLLLTVYTIVGINLFLNLGFYPALLDYQLGSVISRQMQTQHIQPEQLYTYKMDEERALDFYTDHLYQPINDPSQLPPGSCILTNQQGLDSLNLQQGPDSSLAHLRRDSPGMTAHPGLETIYKGGYFHVSTLTLPFLDPGKRDKELTPVYILKRK